MPTVQSWINSKASNRQQNDLLHSLLDALESRFASRELASRSLVSLLNSLAAHLKMHFEWDESDVNFLNLERLAPDLGNELSRLEQEQGELLHDVDVLIGLARIAFAEKQPAATLAERYRAFQKRFADHESQEKRLLQRAYGFNPNAKS